MNTLAPYATPNLLISDHLRRAPLFAALPNDSSDCFATLRKGALFDVPAGLEVVAQGDAPAFFVVTRGCLRDASGRQSWSEGCHFGVAETLARLPFAAAISAVAPTRLYRLDAPLLHIFMALCPAIASRMKAELAR